MQRYHTGAVGAKCVATETQGGRGFHDSDDTFVIGRRRVGRRASVLDANIAAPSLSGGVCGKEVDGRCAAERVVEVANRLDGLFYSINGCHFQWDMNHAGA